MRIKLVEQSEILEPVFSYEKRGAGKARPKGLFYCANAGGISFTAVDNSDGNAWCEDFDTKEEAIAWLKGESDE